MKFRKRISAAIAISLVCAMAFTACSSNGTASSGGTTSTGTPASSGGDSTTEPVVLKWYTETDEVANKNVYKRQEIADAFMEKYPNVKIEIQPLVANTNSDEFEKKVDLMLASNEQIDIINFSEAIKVANKVAAGVLEPLDEYAAKEGADLGAEYTGMMKIDGKYYSLPNQMSAYIVFINQDMLDEAGLELPPDDWTWDDYAEYARKLTKGEGPNKVYGSYFHTWTGLVDIGITGAVKDIFYKEDGSANFDDPALRTFLEFRKNLEVTENVSTPYIDIVTQNIAYRSQFFDGKAAMMPQGTWLLADIKNEQYPHTFKTSFAPLPRSSKDSKANVTFNGATGCGYTVNANSQYKQEAYNLIRFITTEGFDISAAFLSPWKDGDHDSIAKALMGEDESLYDMESFNHVMNDSGMTFNDRQTVRPYDAQIDDVYSQETEKYLTGVQDIDTTINNLMSGATAIIEKNK